MLPQLLQAFQARESQLVNSTQSLGPNHIPSLGECQNQSIAWASVECDQHSNWVSPLRKTNKDHPGSWCLMYAVRVAREQSLESSSNAKG